MRLHFRTLYGSPAPECLSRDLIARLIAHRLQEQRLGKLDRRLADQIDRLGRGQEPRRQLKPGTVLVREHEGVVHEVVVMPDGFLWRGEPFTSLSTIAKRIKGCDTVLTAGALQSNHARITAAAAARLGLSCELLLSEPADPRGPAYGASGNRLLDDLFGARVRLLPPDTDSGPALAARADALRAAGARPYVIPVGGSNALGTLGYLAAALEIADPSIAGAFDVIVLPSGSGGTQAGLALAAALLGAPWQVWGISVGRLADAQGEIVRALGSACCSLIGRSIPDHLPINVFDGARGPGYGRPDLSTRAAMWDAARREGLLLDPVYTAKAMAGLSMLIGTDAVPKGARVLFWHTGGAPAIFGYPALFQERTAAIDPATAI